METIVAESPTFDDLLAKVYRHSGHDFRDYRRGTVMRRLTRRLYASGARTYPEYMRFLDEHPEEYQNLADDLTIKISGFFRSPYSCQQVSRLVLSELLESKAARGEQSLRIWSAACARGEEPYSVAILLAELLRQRRQDFAISIYATDISQPALGQAQAGIYSPKDVEGLPSLTLQNYFIQHDQGYEIRADIKRMVSFSYFDLTSPSPPLVNLDCVFCCNVLIYFQRHLQERVLNMIYESLADPGYLVLGEVETPTGNLNEKLRCLDSKARIYKKVTS